jgi:tocopherol O-methyltransferase
MHGTPDLAPPLTKRAIRLHYDLATPFYRLLWGAHIHHGCWDGKESAKAAQRRLIERLAAEASIAPGSDVLDVGCGMGGSAIHLARHLGCRVTGLTLSPVQRIWATFAAWLAGARRQTHFLCQDAEQTGFLPASFDVLWSIECTEHLFDKAAFFRRASPWLRPGGRVAVCAWLAAERPHTPEVRDQVDAVCRGFLCPSLGTATDYEDWLREAGLQSCRFTDLTGQVMRTWEICMERVRRSGIRLVAWCAGRDMTSFLDHFQTILHAYRSGAMRYGCFVARKPQDGPAAGHP